jgi:transposase-like protein
MHRGNVRAIATYQTQSGRRRIFNCTRCGEQFSETRGTVFFDLRTPEEKVILVLKLLLCKVELTSISFALGVTEETTLEWLRRAAEKAAEINQHLLREVEVTEVQLDELWSFRSAQARFGGGGRWREHGGERRRTPVGVGKRGPAIPLAAGGLCRPAYLPECAGLDPDDGSGGARRALLLQ